MDNGYTSVELSGEDQAEDTSERFFFFFQFFLSALRGMWDLCSLTKDRTCTPCTGGVGLNHWTARRVQLQRF